MNEKEARYSMPKKVLVIGGSAFTGRVFSILASKDSEYELHLVNRGNFPLNLDNVKHYECDRHDELGFLRILPDIKFDALVDFCAYNANEVLTVMKALKGRFGQYIFFSTSSVYEPGDRRIKREGDLLISPIGGDIVADYIMGKVRLEHELVEMSLQIDIPYTILRPSFIYGPFNYAPRESFFIEMIARQRDVPVPTDATARFSLVYVFDVANATLRCIGDSRAYNEVYNLAAPEPVTYEWLMANFERYNGGPFLSHKMTVKEVLEQHIPLPFPLTEDELYSGDKFAKTFDFEYTPLTTGMEKTFSIFYSLFTS
jgi:nucleoside-diphosphate-sugar epimerase